jgi:hypothetical protein
MKPVRLPALWTALAALAFALTLTGCFSDGNMQGGDDYPNSVEPMGKHAAQERADSSEWNAYRDAPSGAPGMYDTTPVPQDPPSQNAPKRAASLLALPSLEVALGAEIQGAVRTVQSGVDSVPNVLRAVRLQVAALGSFSAVDTTWYKAEGAGFRLLRVSGRVSYFGDTRYSIYEDGDGDGFLTPVIGGANVAKIRFTTVFASGRREDKTMWMNAGPDRDFNKSGDNSLMALSKVAVHGLDTLLSLVLSDLDGDGFVFNPLRDSSRVGIESKVMGVGARTELSYRVNVFTDSSRNYAYRYRKVLTTAAGIEETKALGRDSLPDFKAGDSGSVRVRFTSTVAADTLAVSESRYGVLLSGSAGDAAGHRLIQVDREKIFSTGLVSSLRYRLKPAVPVPNGSFARTGALFIRTDLRAGGWVQLTGQAAADISGTLTDSEGRSGTIHLRLDGTVESASGF